MNTSVSRTELMKKLRELDFALIETTLFLDTHPTDKKALAYYKKISDERRDVRDKVIELYGPLTSFENTDTTDWAWIKGPWPWEMEAN